MKIFPSGGKKGGDKVADAIHDAKEALNKAKKGGGHNRHGSGKSESEDVSALRKELEELKLGHKSLVQELADLRKLIQVGVISLKFFSCCSRSSSLCYRIITHCSNFYISAIGFLFWVMAIYRFPCLSLVFCQRSRLLQRSWSQKICFIMHIRKEFLM